MRSLGIAILATSLAVALYGAAGPVLSLPSPITAEATQQSGAIVDFTVTASSASDGHAVPVTCDRHSGEIFPFGRTDVTCSATENGITTTGSFAIAVRDTTPPWLWVPADFTVEATSQWGANVHYETRAHDNIDGELTPVCSPARDSLFPIWTRRVECSAVDAHHNSAYATFQVTVVKAISGPVLHLPSDIATTATSADGAIVAYDAQASGGMDENEWVASFDCTPASGSLFPIGTTTVTCTAVNNSNKSSTGTFHVTVTAPSHADITVEATTFNGAPVHYQSSVQCAPPSGSVFPLGTTKVQCADGTSFNVNVVDTTPPKLTLPADFTTDHTLVKFDAYAYDFVDGKVNVVCTPPTNTYFALGTTTVSCSATDSHANTASGSFRVTVIYGSGNDITAEATSAAGAVVTYAGDCTPASGSTFPLGVTSVNCIAGGTFKVTVVDRTPPDLVLPDDIETTNPVVTFTATAHDLVDGDVTVTCTPASGSTFLVGTTTVQCVARDARANMNMGSFHVTVHSTVPPDVTVEATGAAGAVVTYDAACTPASGSTFPIGTTTVQCTDGTFTITVVDTTDPVLTLPADITTTEHVVAWTATAHDIVDGDVAVSCWPASGSNFESGMTTVHCSSTDAHLNTVEGSFIVTVTNAPDTTPPVLALPADITTTEHTVTFTATAHDDVDGDVAVTCTPPSGSAFAIGTTAVQCSASDAAGNTATGSFNVTVIAAGDNTPPVLTLPADITVEATTGDGEVVAFTATAHDDIDGEVSVSCTPPSGSTFPLGTTIVQCTASDAAGNTTTGTFHVIVEDTAAPVITSISASPSSLWPANHRLIDVTLSVVATDSIDDAPQSRIIAVTANEPVTGFGSGNTNFDWRITAPLTVQLRAERSGQLSDRVYMVIVECVDGSGNRTYATANVTVPHDTPATDASPAAPPSRRRSSRH